MTIAARRKRWIVVIVAIVILAALLYGWQGDQAVDWIKSVLGEGAHPLLFLFLFLILPLIGFPVSVLFVLVGVKFGSLWGVVILFAGMAIHLMVAFLVTRSFLRQTIQGKLVELGYSLPEIPQRRVLWFSCVFMAVPGLPYTVKNYALPLCGVPFGTFFFSGLLFQGLLGVPLVIAGDAVATERILLMSGILAVFIGLIALVQHLAKKHFSKAPQTRHKGR